MKARLFLILASSIMLIGCATQNQSMLSHLQMRVGELERQLELKDEQLKDLRYEIKDLSYDIDRFKSRLPDKQKVQSKALESPVKKSKSETDRRIIRVSANVSEVQTALKSAGFYDGPVDDKIGAKTRSAIADFQKRERRFGGVS